MNLFILTWQMPTEYRPRVLSELIRTAKLYPQLDLDTLWHYEVSDAVFVASVHSAESASTPRSYVAKDKDEVTFYDGLMVDRSGCFNAHVARDLSIHWDRLADSLEGHFVVIRVGDNPPRIELLIDPLGIEQVYYLQDGPTWFLSNSAGLLERLGNKKDLDPLGASLFLTLDWVGGDRTLLRDIRVMEGGRSITWRQDRQGPSHKTYFARSSLARTPRREITHDNSRRLADDLIQMCNSLGKNFGKLNCPLTSGRDSRVMAALLVKGHTPAKYWTTGDPNCADVVIGAQIAQAFGLDHQVSNTPNEPPGVVSNPTEEVIAGWDDLSWRFIRQNDGLASLNLIANILGQPSKVDRLAVTLCGLGGEIARSYYGDLFNGVRSAKQMLALFPTLMVSDYGGLLSREALGVSRSYLRVFLNECLDEGFPPEELPDVFYTYERVRRWASNLAREMAPTEDQFMPFCTRPFIKAAFSMPPVSRYAESLHYELIQQTVPTLNNLPFAKPWRSQPPPPPSFHRIAKQRIVENIPYPIRRMLALMRARLRPGNVRPVSTALYDPTAWLEAKRPQMLEVCLSQPRSSVWSLVNRRPFERLMSAHTGPGERYPLVMVLFAIATICYNDSARERDGFMMN
jgi:asparagine synthase (glutamine-hydrolysing)